MPPKDMHKDLKNEFKRRRKQHRDFRDVFKEAARKTNNIDYDKPRCVWCNSPKVKLTDFKNKISQAEYKISGFCQKCQDKTFGKDL